MKRILLILTLVVVAALLWETTLAPRNARSAQVAQLPSAPLNAVLLVTKATPTTTPPAPVATPRAASTRLTPEPVAPTTHLTRANFESFVAHCFRGEPCVLDDDPERMYEDFKLAGNHRATDNLIAFLRSQLKNADFAAKYKDTLKGMIDNYYSPQERPFQDAAFYDYAGDKERSLELYLDLEKKAAADPSLRGAPKLNIANVLFDLKRCAQATEYYEAAREQILEGKDGASRNEMLAFIDQRLEACR